MAVTRRGKVIYLNDGYSDTAYDVEVATSPYGSDPYRVKAGSEADALEMVLKYKLSKGQPMPFQQEELWNSIYGDDRWMEDCVYVDDGYWICITDFVIRPVSGSASPRSPSKRSKPSKVVSDTKCRSASSTKLKTEKLRGRR